MNDIRKLSLGNEINHLMVYSVGQWVVSNTCQIHQILPDNQSKTFLVYVIRSGEIMLWKSVSMRVPYTLEFNIDFQ